MSADVPAGANTSCHVQEPSIPILNIIGCSGFTPTQNWRCTRIVLTNLLSLKQHSWISVHFHSLPMDGVFWHGHSYPWIETGMVFYWLWKMMTATSIDDNVSFDDAETG
jgi:hypothetical protein